MAFVQSRHMDSWQLAKQSMHPHRITSGRFAHPNSALCLRQQQQQQQSSECTWQSQQESSTRVNPSKCQGCLCFRQTIHFTHRGDLLLLTRMHAWKAACCKRTRLKTHGLGWVAANVCHCTGLYMHTPLLCVQHVSWLCVCVCVCARVHTCAYTFVEPVPQLTCHTAAAKPPPAGCAPSPPWPQNQGGCAACASLGWACHSPCTPAVVGVAIRASSHPDNTMRATKHAEPTHPDFQCIL